MSEDEFLNKTPVAAAKKSGITTVQKVVCSADSPSNLGKKGVKMGGANRPAKATLNKKLVNGHGTSNSVAPKKAQKVKEVRPIYTFKIFTRDPKIVEEEKIKQKEEEEKKGADRKVIKIYTQMKSLRSIYGISEPESDDEYSTDDSFLNNSDTDEEDDENIKSNVGYEEYNKDLLRICPQILSQLKTQSKSFVPFTKNNSSLSVVSFKNFITLVANLNNSISDLIKSGEHITTL